MSTQLNILVLDDEPRVLDEIEEFLVGKNYRVFTAGLPSVAFGILSAEEVNIMILDVKLPEMGGLEVLKKVKLSYPEIEVIMISGHGDMDTVIQAMRHGATDYFPKPFRLFEINNAITRTRRYIEVSSQLKSATASLEVLSRKLIESIGTQLIGESQAMKHVLHLMAKVSQADNTSVLILGESGTGKELVAHGIHYLSQRIRQPFYSVNCSAIPETLFESEFFGHKKGAFTGALEEKPGWFEIADKGTLFLDEISDMPLNQQAKLLRVLEERKVSKLGSKQSRSVDVRVIAASNQNLEEMAEKGTFRNDLFHRLSIFVIEIPPLRNRTDDIPLIARHFVEHYAKIMNKPALSIHPDAMNLLQQHHYPGNIRELRNIIERAVIMCEGYVIMPEHVTFKGKENIKTADHPSENEGVAMNHPDMDLPILTSHNFDLEDNTRAIIIAALEASGNSKRKACELLNITWQALNRRMTKYGM